MPFVEGVGFVEEKKKVDLTPEQRKTFTWFFVKFFLYFVIAFWAMFMTVLAAFGYEVSIQTLTVVAFMSLWFGAGARLFVISWRMKEFLKNTKKEQDDASKT